MVTEQFISCGHQVIAAVDGAEAFGLIDQQDRPSLVILDWMMPGLDGIELCRRIRTRAAQPYIYILLLTVNTAKEDIVTALDAGADGFLSKPAEPEELRAFRPAYELWICVRRWPIASRKSRGFFRK